MSDPALPATVNLRAYHGDTWAQTFRLKHATTPVDLTGATIAAAARLNGHLLELAVTIADPPTAGEFTLGIGDDGLPAGVYTYDVEVTQDANVTTWIRGELNVAADVTPGAP